MIDEIEYFRMRREITRLKEKVKELEAELKEIKDQFYRNELTAEDFKEILAMDYKE